MPLFHTISASVSTPSSPLITHCVAECCGHNLDADLPWPWGVNSHCGHLQWLLAVPGNSSLDLNGLAWWGGRGGGGRHGVVAGQLTGRAGIAELDGPTAATERPAQANTACAVGQSTQLHSVQVVPDVSTGGSTLSTPNCVAVQGCVAPISNTDTGTQHCPQLCCPQMHAFAPLWHNRPTSTFQAAPAAAQHPRGTSRHMHTLTTPCLPACSPLVFSNSARSAIAAETTSACRAAGVLRPERCCTGVLNLFVISGERAGERWRPLERWGR